MNWILSNLAPIGTFGLVLIVLSFLSFSLHKPKLKMFLPGLGICIFVVICGICVTISSPGGQKVVDEVIHHDIKPAPPSSHVERLRLKWNSESQADWPVAETLALFSDSAYLPPVEAEAKFRTLGFDRIKPFFIGSMAGYVVAFEDVTVIVFRGTDDKADTPWLRDHSMKLYIDKIRIYFGITASN